MFLVVKSPATAAAPQRQPLMLVVLLLGLAAECQGAFLSPPSFMHLGQCHEAPVQKGLDLEKFAGLWYTYETVPNDYDPAKSCINTLYTFHGDHLTSRQKGLDEEWNKRRLNTVLTFDPNVTEPVLTVHNEGMPNAPLKIIATDYSSYACFYTCMPFLVFKAEFGLILTRSPYPSADSIKKAREVLSETVGIHKETMESVDQGKHCPYWADLPADVTGLYGNHDASNMVEDPQPHPLARSQKVDSSGSTSSSSSSSKGSSPLHASIVLLTIMATAFLPSFVKVYL